MPDNRTKEQIAESGRQKEVLFKAIRAFKRQYIGNGPSGAVKIPLKTAVDYLKTSWSTDIDSKLRDRAIQKMRNRGFIKE